MIAFANAAGGVRTNWPGNGAPVQPLKPSQAAANAAAATNSHRQRKGGARALGDDVQDEERDDAQEQQVLRGHGNGNGQGVHRGASTGRAPVSFVAAGARGAATSSW